MTDIAYNTNGKLQIAMVLETRNTITSCNQPLLMIITSGQAMTGQSKSREYIELMKLRPSGINLVEYKYVNMDSYLKSNSFISEF